MARLASLSPRARGLLRVGAGLAVVVAVVATVGAGPFVHGLRSVSWSAVIAALVLTGLASAAAVWRWRTVVGALGLELSWRGAIAAYYRSQFLNAVLPGGIVGDVHRAYRHGRRTGSTALAARAVATERIAGQVVQVALVIVVLSCLGFSSMNFASPLSGLAWGVAGLIVLALVVVGVLSALARGRRFLGRELRVLGTLFGDARRTVQIVASSIVVVAAHTTLFVIACRAAGVSASLSELVGLALVALTAGAIPLNIGGWGPREGAAASVFAAVGLGAAAGVAASTTYGVLALIAVLPGVLVLIADRIAVPIPIPLEDQPLKEEVHA